MQDYEEHYAKTWRPIVEHPDGKLNRDQVMRELFDFSTVMGEASKVYEELAGLSKPNTAAEHVLAGADERYAEIYADYLCERAYELLNDDAAAAETAVLHRIADSMRELAEEWHPGGWAAYVQGREVVATLTRS